MKENKLFSGHEIDVVALTVTVFKEWKKLLLYGFIGGVIGIIVAFSTPKEYTATVILAPEMTAGGTGMVSSLAEMASNFGIELGKKSSMDAIYPEIYPDVFMSSDFTQKLLEVPVRLVDDTNPRTYREHLKKDCRVPFWEWPKVWLMMKLKKPDNVALSGGKGGVDPFYISKNDAELCHNLSKNIQCLVDKKTSEITISLTDQDPMVAAIMTDTLQRRLQAYITAYRTHKAHVDYDYYNKMVKESEEEYLKAQKEYADYSDSHMSAVLSSVSSRETELEQNMSNAYTTYAAMIKMRVQAKAQIQESTPAFTVIQSSKLPFKPSSRPRIVTTLLFAFLFGFADACWIAYRKLKGKNA